MLHAKRVPALVLTLAALLLVAGACAAPTPAVIERVVEVTKEVEKVVEVEKQVEVVKEVEKVVEVVGEPFPDGTSMHLVQWSHFVPQYDRWFDPFAKAWGDANNVNVSVDHVALGDIAPTLAGAIDAGQGPTMVEMILSDWNLFVEGLNDLTDVNEQAQALYGEQVQTCRNNSFLPAVGKFFGFCHMWVPDPGDYNKELWTAAGFPDGPETWQDLLEGGRTVREQSGVPLGLGMSPEIDSEMAARGVIWSFGGSVQDENENVVFNSPETIAAVEFMAELFRDTMTEEVFAWNAASNNQALIAGEVSYILNSISAYRTLQKTFPEEADNIFFTRPLKGPGGGQRASAHVWSIYVIPSYVQGAELEAAKAFILHLLANYNQATFNSELYNFPAFTSTVPQLADWLTLDPYGSRPNDKLLLLGEAHETVGWLGYPGPANPAIAQVYSQWILSTMMAQVARGEKTAEEAVADAEAQIKPIFADWRARGLVGGSD